MADDSLKDPVFVQALGITAASLPAIFSRAYQNYVLNQTQDFVAVAGKANEAGQGAWDAQVKNDEQDLVLADHEVRLDAAESTLINHEVRITAAEATLANHEERITAAEAELIDHEARITANEAELADHETRITQNATDIAALDSRLDTAEADIGTLETNSISKAVNTSQSVQATGGSFLVGPITTPTTDPLQASTSVNVGVSYKVAGLQVIGPRQAGWTAGAGTAFKGTFDADQVFNAAATYTQADIQALCDALKEARQRILALEQSSRTHGQIN